MKNKILHKVAGMLVMAILMNPCYAQSTPRVMEKAIVIPARQIRIDSLLAAFSRQTGVEFSFNSRKISSSRMVTVTRKVQTLSEWLRTLNRSLSIQHRLVGNHIIL